MNRTIIPLFAAVMFAGKSMVNGQSYVGSVLYPLTPPSGYKTVGEIYDMSAGQGVGWCDDTAAFPNRKAILWTPTGAVGLNPTGFSESFAFALDGNHQVGYGDGVATGNYPHALFWTGTAASAVDLNPTNLSNVTSSYAQAISGTQEVGVDSGYINGIGGFTHAVLWNGTATNAVDLNPTYLVGSRAEGTNGIHQVGEGWGIDATGNGFTHALLWSGTASSAVDLNPTTLNGINDSYAFAISGTQQVGYGAANDTGNGYAHAMLWNGTADSAVDLNPFNLNGISGSFAFGTNGTEQVGYGYGPNSPDHALLWEGTAASAIDLQTLLPSNGTWSYSDAESIDPSGDVYGWGYGTYNGVTGSFAVEWSPVPEPATGSLLLIASAGILMHRRRKQLA